MNLVKKIPIEKNGLVNVVVEIPRGSSNKYEYDEKNECFRLDRTLHSAMFYPFDYGFIPQSKAGDSDPLDAIVLTEQPTFPGCVVSCRPIGALKMEDQSGEDIKIIAVPSTKIEPRKAEVKDIKDLPEHQKKEITNFMQQYKALEPKKWVKVHGFKNAQEAIAIIKESADKFKKRGKGVK